ncbi:MAG TPA: thioesterase family protein [Sandaracinaceae bacterium LLY-WYZ-13_1]|nr:thioesterase family protein [Sandaracinaceae bacterium LLY-WYZ-13_1]
MDDFPIQIRVPVAWGDMDAFQHVNNTVYFRWFESVRIECFRRIGWTEVQARTGVGPILARTQCVYRKPVTFPDTVLVGARVDDLGEDRFTMVYRVDSERLGPEAATGDGRIVSFDYRAGKKAPLPAEVREALEGL